MDESTSNHTHPPSRQQAAVGGSRASSKATHAPSAKLWKQVNVHRTLRPLHGPPRARSLHSTSLPYCGYVGGPDGPACTVSGCRELPSRLAGSWGPSDSAMRFSSPGVLPSSGASTSQQWRQPMPMTCERYLCPTGEGRDGTGPSSRYEGRVFQPLLHCAQEKRWVTTNLGSAHLDAQDAHAEPRLRMHPSPSSVCSIDLKTRTSMCRSFRATGHSCGLRSKDEHISTGPALRAVPIAPCLHESSGGSPCSLERSGRAHSQLPRRLAHTGSVSGSVMRTQGLVLSHLSQLGLRVNWEKSKLLPMQRISFLGMEFGFGQSDSAPHAGTRSVGVELLEYIQEQDAAPLKQFQRLLGHMAAAAAVTPLGLLHMRPLQHWLHGRVPRWAWQSGTLRVQVTPACRQTFTPWSDLSFLRAGVPLEQVSRHAVVYTDASAKGWGATFNGHAVSGVWTGPQLHWHINCLELLAVHLALNRLKRRLRGEHVLVRTDNTATVAYINRQGGLCHTSHVTTRPPPPPLESEASEVASRHSYPGLAQPDSRRAVTSCAPRRMETPSPDGPADLATFWTRTDRPVRVPRDVALPVVLLPDRWNTRHGRTGTQLAAGPSQICISPSEPSRTDSVQGQRGRGADPARGTILAYQDLVPRADAPRDSPSLADSSEEGSTDSETGHLMAPASRPLETSCLVPRRDAEVLGDLPQGVVDTITSARAPSTRHAYALKWNLFIEWCSSHREDPRRCPIRVVLSFLQQGLERRLSPSTLKVYVAAIAANHDPVEGKSVGKHDWVVRFLRGARRLNPPRPPSIPSWDLSLVLRALQQGPFEPLQTVEPKFLSMKTLLLPALASIKRVGDLHAFSVDDSCLQFGPADSQIILRPRPGYVPKVPTTPFRDQVVSLQALPPEEADPALALLCPVRALRHYVDRTQSFRTSDQLFVCHGGRQKGNAVSKQGMAHWIVDAITLAYQAQGVPCPFRLRAHSTRSVASSWALARGTSLTDICRAAGWATPNTFARFYSLRVEPVSSCVLTSNG